MKRPTNFTGNFAMWLFLLIVFYYPIAACIISFTNLPSTPINIAIRALFPIMAILLIVNFFLQRRLVKFNVYVYWLLLFWLIYSIRIIYDVLILEIPYGDKSSFLVLSMVFANGLLPMLSILLNSKLIDLKKMMINAYRLLIISNTLILFVVFFVQKIDESFFYRRATIQQTIGGEDVDTLNPITIGFTGALLAILALSKLLVLKGSINTRILAFSTLCIGLTNLIIGASRGPFIFFIIVLFIILFKHFKVTKFNISYNLKLTLMLFFLILSYFKYIQPLFIANEQIALISRVFSFYENVEAGEKEERYYSFNGAWQDFINSPIIGKQYVGTYDNFYPHNVPLEVLMATGIIGGICFFLFFGYIFEKIISQKNKNYYLLEFKYILIPLLLLSLTSGSLMFSSDLWLTVAYYSTIDQY